MDAITESPLCYRVPSEWLDQIQTLVTQIEHPTVEYCDDQVAMANDAISDQKRRATIIQSMINKLRLGA